MILKAVQKRRLFALEYLVDLNGRKAAIRAGYAPKCAAVTASQLLSYPDVQAVVTEARGRLESKTKVTIERIIKELATLGFSNLAGKDNEQKALPSKVRALELLGKHLGMFPTKIDGDLRLKVQGKLSIEALKQSVKGLADGNASD